MNNSSNYTSEEFDDYDLDFDLEYETDSFIDYDESDYEYKKCSACFGTGLDREYDVDCVVCYGMGEV